MRRKYGRSPEQRYQRFIDGAIQSAREKVEHRGFLVISRKRSSNVHAHQLTDVANIQCRVLGFDVDAGIADPEDVGLFWFTAGYSKVGGPDKVRP